MTGDKYTAARVICIILKRFLKEDDTCILLQLSSVIALVSSSRYNFSRSCSPFLQAFASRNMHVRDGSLDTKFTLTEHILHAHNK